MSMYLHRNLFLIAVITMGALIISAPKNYPVKLTFLGRPVEFVLSSPTLRLGSWSRDLEIKQGLDLKGGIEVTLQADMGQIPVAERSDALVGAREVIARRVDLYGVAESTVKTVVSNDNYRILVALPGVNNPDEALSLIGQTARLDFREYTGTSSATTTLDLSPTGLSGNDLKKATVSFDNQTGKPQVSLEFTTDGAKKFGEITSRNVGKQVWILLDDMILTDPVVSTPILDGAAVITGDYTVEQAKNMVITLNAGALPVPITVVKQQNVAPSLGEGSVQASLRAGAVGLGLVALFMVLNYGGLGAVAVIGLLIYGLITLALYKLIPVTLTLPGLAGFILSIGMAVDSNILVFERMKEEMRKGHDRVTSMESGFGKAWDSIKDANVATLITTFILFNPLEWSFLNSSGMVRGFALTLFLGIVVSLFTGLFVTRTLLRSFIRKQHE